MFAWLKKKPKPSELVVEAVVEAIAPVEASAETSAPPTTRAMELIGRWDGAIHDIRARFQAVLDEAVAGSEPLIAAIRTDLTPLVLPWNTITPRQREAQDEVSNAWDQISDEMSACGGFSHEAIRKEGSKRDEATLELELLHQRAYGGVMARAADRMREVSLGADAATHPCNHCGATLDKVTPVSQSLNVECAYCKSINTVHPGDALRMFAAVGAMFLAIEAARPLEEAMKRLERSIKDYRDAKDVPLALLVELEATSRRYWTARLSEEARYNPEEAKYVPGKIDRYMKDVQKTLRRHWQWREHESKTPSP